MASFPFPSFKSVVALIQDPQDWGHRGNTVTVNKGFTESELF